MLWKACIATLVLASAGCRIDCLSAADCDRGEICGADGVCEGLPGAAPLGAITPGDSMEVMAVFPPPDSRDAPARGPVVVLTTRPVDPVTITTRTFWVEDVSRQAVPGTVDFLVDPPGVVFVPQAALDAGASYNVGVTSDVRDVGGERLRASVVWTFSVAGQR